MVFYQSRKNFVHRQQANVYIYNKYLACIKKVIKSIKCTFLKCMQYHTEYYDTHFATSLAN